MVATVAVRVVAAMAAARVAAGLAAGRVAGATVAGMAVDATVVAMVAHVAELCRVFIYFAPCCPMIKHFTYSMQQLLAKLQTPV